MQTEAQAIIGQPYNENWKEEYEKSFSLDVLNELEKSDSGPMSLSNNREVFKSHHEKIAPSVKLIFLNSSKLAFSGKYHAKRKLIVINSPSATEFELNTLFHELWHYAENEMIGSSELQIVYDELHNQGHKWGDDYLDAIDERAARAFADYANARNEGLTIPSKRGTAARVFERLYDGKIYEEFAKAGHNKNEKGNVLDNALTALLISPIIFTPLATIFLIINHNIHF
ncbi:hypothetical protein [Gluconobacter kondonii]|uniref:hypothetical protein n=1 Tax=Gluconobacter kondonii TaxID=941463 RepID=UPI001B8C6AD7|nr:hypothetical protein [Gluconobacter kondonii]MBS1054762.1 hypothetical protein [Gluconobacter kondonii]